MITRMELEVIVHRDAETGGFWAEVAQLPGCFAAGHTKEELRESLREAVRLYLENEDASALLIQDHVESVDKYLLSEDHEIRPAL